MKKSILIALLVLVFVGCSKEKDNAPKLDDRLVNTKWQTRAVAYEIIYGGTAYDVYEFISTTEVEQYTVKNNNVVQSLGTLQYTLKYPDLTIQNEKGNLDFEFQDSRTFVRKGTNGSSPYQKYIKQ
jgi:hypothetical protein